VIFWGPRQPSLDTFDVDFTRLPDRDIKAQGWPSSLGGHPFVPLGSESCVALRNDPGVGLQFLRHGGTHPTESGVQFDATTHPMFLTWPLSNWEFSLIFSPGPAFGKGYARIGIVWGSSDGATSVDFSHVDSNTVYHNVIYRDPPNIGTTTASDYANSDHYAIQLRTNGVDRWDAYSGRVKQEWFEKPLSSLNFNSVLRRRESHVSKAPSVPYITSGSPHAVKFVHSAHGGSRQFVLKYLRVRRVNQ